ncbi:polysaccharide biosynthesis tyrosine autokinase [Microbacterium sp.]|uniref:polysaccharide biosynthesis tyrosine autokinase n=1 Tax=Microbacterium sp. TaxID=51671 RepID=UPI0025D2E071|nr:polysaccharide biosynthesis tyrosine autokinase [Microbacterium sp.]
MGLQDLQRVWQRFWSLVVSGLAVGLLVAAGAIWLIAPSYTSSARLFVSNQAVGSANDLLQGSTYTQTRMLSYAQVATDPIVLDPVIEELGLDTTAEALASQVTASAERDQLIISIEVSDPTPDGAAEIVNAVANRLSEVITTVIEEPLAGRDAAVAVTVLKEGVPATEPSWPVLWIFLTVGGGAGLLAGIGMALLLNTLDTRVRALRDLQDLTTLPVLGMITKTRRFGQTSLVNEMSSRSQFAESVRALRTNLQFVDAQGKPRRVLLITSTVPSEGKSTTALSLALSLAEAGKRVVLIDADMRKPRLATALGLEGAVGLTDVLIGRFEYDAIVQPVGAEHKLSVITAGMVPPNPAELLGGVRFTQLLEKLRSEFDYVVIDSPPVLAVTDAVLLSQRVDAVVYVVGVERVRRPQLQTGLEALARVDAPVVGLVVNHLPRSGVDAYTYYWDAYSEEPAKGRQAAVSALSEDAASERRLRASASQRASVGS